MAEAMLGFGDKAAELFRMINPIEHSRTKAAAQKYKVEPYVIAADVYGAENLIGEVVGLGIQVLLAGCIRWEWNLF